MLLQELGELTANLSATLLIVGGEVVSLTLFDTTELKLISFRWFPGCDGAGFHRDPFQQPSRTALTHFANQSLTQFPQPAYSSR